MFRYGKLYPALALGALALIASPALATDRGGKGGKDCDIISHETLRNALRASVAPTGGPSNGGFDLHMWATVVNRDGVVCQVAFSGEDRGDQWPGSRVISAQKANTANAFSLPLTAPIPGLALSTANLWAPTQPGGSLFALPHSNPVDTAVAYGGPDHTGGDANNYGQPNDPMVGEFIGGVNVFGGGLALYNSAQELVGAVGVSGDTSCADHNVAWRVRHELGLDWVPAGVSGDPERPDNINYIGIVDPDTLAEDFSHPICTIAGEDTVSDVSANLPPISTP